METLCLEPQYHNALPVNAQFNAYAINDIYENSLLLTSPEAAGQVILPEQPVHFHYRHVTPADMAPWLQSGAEMAPERGFMLDLQRACLILLRRQEYGINQRLILLGLFLEDAADYVATERGHQLGALIKSYNAPTFRARFDEAMRAIQFEPPAYLSLLWDLLGELARRQLLQDTAAETDYRELIRQVFSLNELQEAQRTERTYQDCHQALQTHVQARWPLFMENSLIYAFFERFYPCSLAGGIVHNYWVFVSIYKLFELMLMTLAVVRRDQLHLHESYALLSHMERLQLQPGFTTAVEHYIQPKEEQSLELFNALYDIRELPKD